MSRERVPTVSELPESAPLLGRKPLSCNTFFLPAGQGNEREGRKCGGEEVVAGRSANRSIERTRVQPQTDDPTRSGLTPAAELVEAANGVTAKWPNVDGGGVPAARSAHASERFVAVLGSGSPNLARICARVIPSAPTVPGRTRAESSPGRTEQAFRPRSDRKRHAVDSASASSSGRLSDYRCNCSVLSAGPWGWRMGGCGV